MSSNPYRRHRFPPEVIAHAVWLYYRFPLSLRDVEELLAARGSVSNSSRRARRDGTRWSDQALLPSSVATSWAWRAASARSTQRALFQTAEGGSGGFCCI